MGNEHEGSSTVEHLLDLVTRSSGVEQFLDDLANYSAEELAGSKNILCAITLKRHRKTTTVACSDGKTRELAAIQYSFTEGPGLQAAQTGTTVLVPDLSQEQRWPEYAKTMTGQGIRSILAVALPLNGEAEAALILYSAEPHVFSAEIVVAAEAYAIHAAKLLSLSVHLGQHQDVICDLKLAMESRTTIDLAVGGIMAQNRCSQDEAVGILRRASNDRNIKLRDLAGQIVERISSGTTNTHFEE